MFVSSLLKVCKRSFAFALRSSEALLFAMTRFSISIRSFASRSSPDSTAAAYPNDQIAKPNAV